MVVIIAYFVISAFFMSVAEGVVKQQIIDTANDSFRQLKYEGLKELQLQVIVGGVTVLFS